MDYVLRVVTWSILCDNMFDETVLYFCHMRRCQNKFGDHRSLAEGRSEVIHVRFDVDVYSINDRS